MPDPAALPLTIILPFFDEDGWIGRTVASLAGQRDQRFRLVLVDNGSTDGSAAEARINAAPLGPRATLIDCPMPGKTSALAAGLACVQTPLVATCDADTYYPPDYVGRIIAMFAADPAAAAVMAIDLYAPEPHLRARARVMQVIGKSVRHPSKCHAGGFAQAYRTALLRRAGGFDAARWPYVLEDHEIAHRVMRFGPARYDPAHVCFPSARRADRKGVHWTGFERFLYRHLPPSRLDWFFYDFLGPRLARRGAHGPALRRKSWASQ